MNLDIQLLPIDKVHPNSWNPNKQSERQFEAEVESILAHGFLAPILVRESKKGFEILDGEHRRKAMSIIIDKKMVGAKNIPDLVAAKQIPAIVIEVGDAQAKKLTVIMNETRGRAELGELAILLESISDEMGDDLLVGLPYSEKQLADLLSLSEFDWDKLESIDLPEPQDEDDDEDVLSTKIVALLSPNTELLWKEALIQNAAFLPRDEKQAAGKLIEILLTR
jgi:ParB-like chromosome segregation protein Spo0J